MMKISIQPKQLYEGCIQAAITHAIAVGMYPELNYEHSWDNMNYCMNNAQGCKATITFHKKYVIGVFQDVDKIDCHKNALVFFDGAPEEVIKIAENETLQYVLENVNGVEKPVISAAFWGTWDKLYSLQSFDSIVENGGHIIRSQLLPFNEAIKYPDFVNTLACKKYTNTFIRKTAYAEYTIGSVPPTRKSLPAASLTAPCVRSSPKVSSMKFRSAPCCLLLTA